MGWALFSPDDTEENYILDRSGTIKSTEGERKGKDEIRIVVQIMKIRKLVDDELNLAEYGYGDSFMYPVLLLIEKPKLWTNVKSMASQRQGGVMILHILVGALFWFGWQNFENVELVDVSTWKGQLPKSVTLKQVKRRWNVNPETDDEADAIGIGSWYIDKLAKE